MLDNDLRTLELRTKENPSDEWARYRYRLALVRAGRGEEAGLQVGDEVEVHEEHGAYGTWCSEPWEGLISKIQPEGSRHVVPKDIDFVVANRKRRLESSGRAYGIAEEYAARGLYLTKDDTLILISPSMPRMISKERLDEIKQRASRASQGPWHVGPGISGFAACGPLPDEDKPGESWIGPVASSGSTTEAWLAWKEGNASFIAHSRQDVPDLIAEVERLHSEVERLTGIVRDVHGALKSAQNHDDVYD